MSRPQDKTDGAALQLLTIAAAKRRECPSNDELARAVGARGAAAGGAALARLERSGLITVERLAGWRTVTIVENGLRTQ